MVAEVYLSNLPDQLICKWVNNDTQKSWTARWMDAVREAGRFCMTERKYGQMSDGWMDE